MNDHQVEAHFPLCPDFIYNYEMYKGKANDSSNYVLCIIVTDSIT